MNNNLPNVALLPLKGGAIAYGLTPTPFHIAASRLCSTTLPTRGRVGAGTGSRPFLSTELLWYLPK